MVKRFILSIVLLAAGTLLDRFWYERTVHAEPDADARKRTMLPTSTRNKYALLVGVSKYARGNKERDMDWWDLNTKGDMEILADVLIRKFEFKPENIKILTDEPVTVDGKLIPAGKPTHEAIKRAFQEFIIDKTNAGDIVYFHFSGHGQQVPDDNGDEVDGMDETIIPADYVSQKGPARNIRDDEIGEWLDALSKKNPANVTITLDSCFSGTATRGEDLRRGGPWKGDEIDKKFAGKSDDSFGDFVTSGRGSRGGPIGEQKYVFISAASPRQTAKEAIQDGTKYGAFTFAFAKALENSGRGTTYRDLFENVTNLITRTQRDQTPQVEGNHLDKIIMEDGAIPTQRFVPVQINGPNLYLKAGKLQGMAKGSRFALFPAGAKEYKEGEQIAIAEIERVNPTSSPVKIIGSADPERLKQASRAFEVEHSYNDVLKVAIAENTTAGAKFAGVFKNLGLAESVPANSESWNVLIRPPAADGADVAARIIDAKFKGVLLQRHDGSIIAAVAEGPRMDEDVQNTLQGEATWQLVKSFDENTNPDLNVITLSMIPVMVDEDPTTHEVVGYPLRKDGFAERGGKVEVRACIRDPQTKKCRRNSGDSMRLEIKNTGTRNVYVSILNLRSDGKIGPAFPIDNRDNLIKAGTTYLIPYAFEVTEPYGQESFRAIVTESDTDFTPLIDTSLLGRGPETDGGRNAAASPLGIMLRNAARGKRGEPLAPPASWATATITYFIVPTVNN